MVRRDEAELIAYLAKNADRARIALREAPDSGAALAALERAAHAVSVIPHPDEPDFTLTSACWVAIEDGVPTLRFDAGDYGDRAPQIATAILDALDGAGAEGRLEPFPHPEPPFDYDPRTDMLAAPADPLWELGEDRLPPAFPAGFPAPPGGELVQAQAARTGMWQHAAWRLRADRPPYEDYPARLRAFGCTLAPHPVRVDEERGGMHGYELTHAGGSGAVWLYHESLDAARRHGRGSPRVWFVSVVWRPNAEADTTPLPLPARIEVQRGKKAKPEAAKPEGAELEGAAPEAARHGHAVSGSTAADPHGASAALDLATSERGLLYQRGLRAMLGPLLAPGPLLGCETVFAMIYARRALRQIVDQRPRFPGHEWLTPLRSLQLHRAGVPLDELLEQLEDLFDSGDQDPHAFLDEMERDGWLIRAPGAAGSTIARFTDDALRVADDHMRQDARLLGPLIDGIDGDRLALVRHVCLRMVVNSGTAREPGPGARLGGWLERLDREEDRLYSPEVRAYIGPLEPEHVRRLEAVYALRGSESGTPKLPLDRPVQPLLWLHQQREGMTRDQLSIVLDGDDLARFLFEGEEAGVLTRSRAAGTGDRTRTGDRTGAGDAARAGDDPEVVRLARSGHEGVRQYLDDVTRRMERFDGVDQEELAMVRDACWRIVENHLRHHGDLTS
jgi:hypothetical protein